ncbi:hypothetical protein HO133_007064 [Letharia lupina]|uniref:2EXR domain-containing protein n=1 Tax=Letharia lupina TaxID=560253 RepID=A0A8H6FI49_9LECA|nr:uncharacterized protein HO133_007064 [Letharia lupina]KAF6228952.1 hypothetical protein HO133_007064 [Letharia lupina]
MPWVHGDDYMVQKNAELKHLLLLRRLPYSGTKAKMTSRLIAHDLHHPFPFQKLPPEIRNEIYTLVASQDVLDFPGSKQPGKGHTESLQCFSRFEGLMVNSSLFRACEQTRAEGLMIFYGYHHFELAVEHGGCFLAILLWLQNIGHFGRKNIRHLNISYVTKCSSLDMRHMDQIHEKLSDQATVTYTSHDYPGLLWKIGDLYERRNYRRVPVFRIGGADGEITTYQYTINFDDLYRGWGRLQYSLVFYPGKSWFGQKTTRCRH